MAISYTQALLDRATAYSLAPLTARRYGEGLAELTSLYATITGQAVGTCRQCQYSDFMAVVTAYIREATRFLHPELMADSKYAFAPAFANETISDGRYNKNVTAENLTDEDAKALLKLGYGHVIVEKGKATAEASGSDTAAASTEPSQGEKKAQAAVEKHKQAEKEAKDALKAEKEAHKVTQKELTDTKKLLAESEAKLADVTGKLADATKAAGDGAKDADDEAK